MMDKSKTLKNTPVGAMRYWWSRALFARQFEIEVNLPPARLAHYLDNVHQPMEGWIEPSGRTVTIREIEPERMYEFEMLLKRRSRGQDYTRARANGRIVYSEGYQTSIIRGDVRLAASNLLIHVVTFIPFVLAMLFAFSSGVPDLYIPVIGLGLLTLLFTSWQIFADYHELQAVLLYQIEQAHQEQLAADLSSDQHEYPLKPSGLRRRGRREE